MDTTLISTEVVELLSRISRQKLREQDITPLVVFVTALIAILRGVMIIDRTIAVEEEERLQKTLKAFAAGDPHRIELIQRLVKGVSKQQVYFNPTELLTLTAFFSESEKLLLIGSGYEMSAVDGHIDLREQMYLQSIANRLALDPRHQRRRTRFRSFCRSSSFTRTKRILLPRSSICQSSKAPAESFTAQVIQRI
jgi:uncharacterized tellurite resistance protein B-like protein